MDFVRGLFTTKTGICLLLLMLSGCIGAMRGPIEIKDKDFKIENISIVALDSGKPELALVKLNQSLGLDQSKLPQKIKFEALEKAGFKISPMPRNCKEGKKKFENLQKKLQKRFPKEVFMLKLSCFDGSEGSSQVLFVHTVQNKRTKVVYFIYEDGVKFFDLEQSFLTSRFLAVMLFQLPFFMLLGFFTFRKMKHGDNTDSIVDKP